MKSIATLLTGAFACPFANQGGLGAVPSNTTETWSSLPDPDYAYNVERTSVVKQPGLLRDPTKNAFLGTMGPCGNKSLYQSYLMSGELYHCQLDETLVAWAKT
jgi:hypothetical protein